MAEYENKLIKLPSFSYTQYDFDSIIADVQSLIEEHPEYNDNWDAFLESDAGRMIVELFSYITEKQSSKIDWIARELFPSTATKRQSLIDILSLINYKPTLPNAAKVNVTATISKWVPPFDIKNREKIYGKDTNGNQIAFECIEMASDGKPNYDYIFHVDSGTEDNKIKVIPNIPFYQGQTIIETDIYTDGISNETYQLQSSPVIESTVRVFSETTGKEYVEVDSFISPEAQQGDVPLEEKTIPYMTRRNADNEVTIVFGNDTIVDIPIRGEKLRIIYRIGGGSRTNVVAGAINTTKTYNLGNERTTLIFNNPKSGYGGQDVEDINQAKLTAPLSLRTANKTVTREDYITHLKENQNIMHATIVSKENEPTDIIEEYGYSIPSLDTWIYVTPYRENLESLNPLLYQKALQVSKPYNVHKIFDYEDIELNTNAQTVLLKKRRKNYGNQMYVTIFDPNNDQRDAFATSFIEGQDYIIDDTRNELTRITTAEGGTIPPDYQKLRVFYVSDNFESNGIFTFSSGKITLSLVAESLYPNFQISIYNKKFEKYIEGQDYDINWGLGTVDIVPSGNIVDGETVFVEYANDWDKDGDSEEKMVLDSIRNKKMLCVDNYIKDSVYSTFDLSLKVYCYKNLRDRVQNNLPDFIRQKYSIKNLDYDNPINKADIISSIMNYDGVRFVEVEYLGRNYYAYHTNMIREIDDETMIEMQGQKVEHKIEPKYNEIIVLAADEFDGIEIETNKRHGLIMSFVDA